MRLGLVAATLLAVAMAANRAFAAGDDEAQLMNQLRAAHERVAAAAAALSARGISEPAELQRLDRVALTLHDDAPDYGPEQWADADVRIGLELKLAEALVVGTTGDIAAVRGLSEVLVPSTVAGGPQPVAIYVPPTYDGRAKLALVVLLHGLGETENHALAHHELTALAAASNAAIVAPYALGDDGFGRDARTQVYEALDAAQAALAVDARHVYLAGISNGGIALFRVGAEHADRFAGFMGIPGAIDPKDAPGIIAQMRTHTFYIVAGDRDPVIPVDASRSAVRFLRRIGAAASFYEQPDGVHSIASLAPAIGRAWSDMFAGVVRTNDGLTPTPVDTGSGPTFDMPGRRM